MENNRAGIKDIARVAKVSLATVDRVLHNRKGVSEATRKKILEAIKQLDFKPNLIASKLSLNKNFNITVLLPKRDEMNSFWGLHETGLLKAREELHNFNFNLDILKYDQTSLSDFQEKASQIKNSKIDGLILAPKFSGESKALIENCNNNNIPVILIDSDLPDSKVAMKIGLPLFEAGKTAASLFDYSIPGEKNILILHLVKNISYQKHLLYKEEGFREYFLNKNHHKTTIITEVLTEYSDAPDGERINNKYLESLFKKYPDINGIYVSNAKTGLIAKYLKSADKGNIFMVGHDLLEENISFLNEGYIDFLICQNPEYQTYKAIYSMYDLLFRELEIPEVIPMSINIVNKTNYMFYNNFNN